MFILNNTSQLLKNIKEKQENYNKIINEIIEELKCKDCIELDCRFCRLIILQEMQSNVNKLCNLIKDDNE